MVPRREGLIDRRLRFLIARMKILPVALFAVLSGLASAETTAPSTSIPAEVVQNLSVMTTRLKLTPSQQDRIRPILVEELRQKQLIEKSTLSDKQKFDQVGANHRAALQKIKAVFTPAQLAQIEDEMDHPAASSTNPGK